MSIRRLAATIAAAASALPALAQTSTIAVTHDDPDGILDPGQTIRVVVRVSWTQGWTLGTLGGHAVASGDAGHAANPVNGFAPAFGGAVLWPGTPVLGSIRDFGAAVQPNSHVYPAAFYEGWRGTDALTYDWTAPAARAPWACTLDFEFMAGLPQVYLYPGAWPWGSPPMPAETTVVPATVTVTPAPGAFWVLGLSLAAGRRRRLG